MNKRIVYYRAIDENHDYDIFQFKTSSRENLEYDIQDAAEHHYRHNDGWEWWDRDTVVIIEIVNEDGTEIFGKGSVTMEYVPRFSVNMDY